VNYIVWPRPKKEARGKLLGMWSDMSLPSMVYNKDRKVQLQVGPRNTDENGIPKLVNAVKEKGIKGIEVGLRVPWSVKGYFNAYLYEADDGPLKGKTLLRIFLNKTFPNPGW
jgi:hypothetical protein